VKRLHPAVPLLLVSALILGGCVTSKRDHEIASEFYDLGNAYVELGKYDKAIAEFQAALKIDPGFVKADYNLALAYAHAKRTDDAIAILKKLLMADPENTQVLSALGWAYHLAARDTDALVQYTTVVRLSPADLNALYNAGIILWKLKRPQEAMEKFNDLLARAPDDTDALYAAGSLLLSLDDAAGSADMISRYLDKKPADNEGWYLLAAAAERQKKYTQALAAYDKIIALDSAQGDAWFGETRLLLTVVEDPQRGLEALAKALGAGFKDPKAVQALLDAPGLLERDKVEAALKDKGLLPAPAPAAAPSTPSGTPPFSGSDAKPPAGSDMNKAPLR
jgi:tetratricopeptide (TPR) repeat protein